VHGSDYAVISRRVKQAGLLDRRRGYYWAKIPLTLAGYVAGWVLFVVIGDSWYQAITAVVLGVVFTQVAFLGHDAGHRQVFASRRGNDLLGLVVGDLLLGLSFDWWVDKHTRHHVHPNEEDADPDIGDGVLAFTQRQVLARTSSFGRSFARKQAWLFFPLLTLEALNLHAASVRTLLTGHRHRFRAAEVTLLAVHFIGYGVLVLAVLSPARALMFVAIQQGVFGLYMGCSFAPNHKGMPTLAPDNELDYLRRQVLTSRNVRGSRVVDLVLGGLNYQIEHHLFPSMPRPNLRHAQPLVRAYCAELNLPYAETSLAASYVTVLRHLHGVGAPLRGDRA
jgi:fatty acid desaturase